MSTENPSVVPASNDPHLDPARPHARVHEEIFSKEKSFVDLGLRSSVTKGIEAIGFKQPTAIQAQLIPVALTGKDILGQAKTGTGKTAAFALPLIHMAQRDIPGQALILAPTRELAVQIAAEIDELSQFTPIRCVPIFGGQRISTQEQKLKHNPEILVGTPGRVIDMMERGLLKLGNVKFLVLDEVDRMLDIGFREDIRLILKRCPSERQTIFVSATISDEIEKLARGFMRNPEKLVSTSSSLTVSLVEQHYLAVQPWDKKKLLLHLLTHEEPALTLVFCRLKRSVDEVARYLSDKGIDAHPIHADLGQGRRNTVMKKLRAGDLSVVIASDLASRGIDVEDISHVINYDLPDDIELYVHRIGRTARAGRRGIAWSFVTPAQGQLLTDIEHLINAEIPKLEYPDFTPSPKPSTWRDEVVDNAAAILAGANVAPKQNRFATTVAPPVPKEVDQSKFPGGVVPTRMPPKRMFGRVKTGRRG